MIVVDMKPSNMFRRIPVTPTNRTFVPLACEHRVMLFFSDSKCIFDSISAMVVQTSAARYNPILSLPSAVWAKPLRATFSLTLFLLVSSLGSLFWRPLMSIFPFLLSPLGEISFACPLSPLLHPFAVVSLLRFGQRPFCARLPKRSKPFRLFSSRCAHAFEQYFLHRSNSCGLA